MQRLEVSCAVRPLQSSLGVKGLNCITENIRWTKGRGLASTDVDEDEYGVLVK